jgi:hypothetical protein
MDLVNWGSLIFASAVGSLAILASMYVLLPALGLPRLDFAAITGGWVGATGPHSGRIGVAIFVLGGIAWAFLYARFWPWHSAVGGAGFAMIPFAISTIAVLPELNRFRVPITRMPGFVWVKAGGPNAIVANLIEHLIFGVSLGMFYV